MVLTLSVLPLRQKALMEVSVGVGVGRAVGVGFSHRVFVCVTLTVMSCLSTARGLPAWHGA